MSRLESKVAIITAGGSGIRAATAKLFAVYDGNRVDSGRRTNLSLESYKKFD